MEVIKGIPVSPGYAISKILLVDNEPLKITRRFINADEIDAEFARFTNAVSEVSATLTRLSNEAKEQPGMQELQQIFLAHIMIVDDHMLRDDVWQRISKNRFSAQYAVSRSFKRYKERFTNSGNPYISQRVSDLNDIENSLLTVLLGERRINLQTLDHCVVVVAHDLPPSSMATLNQHFVSGIALDVGGRTSHTAIVARAREIPAVVALGDFSSMVSDGDQIIIDGNRGIVIVDPNEEMLASYTKHVDTFNRLRSLLADEDGAVAKTVDDVEVRVSMNIEFADEIANCIRDVSDGVGLYRTEFLYLSLERVPSEEEHLKAYDEVLQHLHGRNMTIRTYDLGADKILAHSSENILKHSFPTSNDERNPALGCRAIRYCLKYPNLLRSQIRAICRAAAKSSGQVRILLPMVCCREEVVTFREMLQREQEALEKDGVEFAADIAVGIMVEIPAVAMNIDNFADICDFFSIGTNDLTQYAMAVDRGNENVSDLYRPANMGVLRLINTAIKTANKCNTEISICGEIAGDPLFTFLLLGMGLRNFSVSPPRVAQIKRFARSISTLDAEIIAEEAMSLPTSTKVLAYLRENVLRRFPDFEFVS